MNTNNIVLSYQTLLSIDHTVRYIVLIYKMSNLLKMLSNYLATEDNYEDGSRGISYIYHLIPIKDHEYTM